MKRYILAGLFLLSVSFSWAQVSLLHGKATGDNIDLDFDDSYSTVGVDINSFQNDVCKSGKKGFLLTGYVDRKTTGTTGSNGYVYFSEDDGDSTISSCVAIVLSGTDFVLLGTGATDSGTGYKMIFDNLKLIYNNTDKVYYFSGKSYDNAYGQVANWQAVYVSGLNLIDWNNTIVDYSSLTNGNLVANGLSGSVNIILKDVAGNEVNILDSIKVDIVSTSSDINSYVYLDENKNISKTLSVVNGVLTIPMYILKATNNGEIQLRFSYDIADMDGNTQHIITISNISVKQPVSDISLSIKGVSIVGEIFTGSMSVNYVDTGKINSISITGTTYTDINYNLVLVSSTNTGFEAKITPKNPNNTISKIDSTYLVDSYTIGFSNFSDISVSYPYTKNLNIVSYADKRVDYNKSFTGMVLVNQYTGGDVVNTLAFKPILKDKNGYVIPDVKFDIKIKDTGIANSYSGWDCDEISAGYQTNCNALQFVFDGNVYSGDIDSVLGAKFKYKNTNSNYDDIKVVSYKPVTGGKLKFEISNLENTSSDWNFTNSGNYLNLPNNYNGYIENVVFKPFVNIRLVGLDEEENYVDINNNIYLKLENISSNNLTISYDLSGEITYPTSGVEFATGEKLLDNNVYITGGSNKLLEQTILFSLSYRFDDNIKFNYNHGQYSYSLNGIGSLILKPRNFYFNLGATYKIGGSYVNGIVNKAQKYVSSVKNIIGRKQKAISTKFVSIYNKLRKKVNYLTNGTKGNYVSSIDPTLDLRGGLKYYNCGNGTNIIVKTGNYMGSNTVILKNCKLIIKGNIIKTNKDDSLVFFLFDDYPLNLETQNYLDRVSNVYIAENVSDIYAGIFTRGSIFTIEGDNINNIWLNSRIKQINEKQLYIRGSLMGRNNVGGSYLVYGEDKFTIGGSKKVYKTGSFWGKNTINELRNIAQIFDINFWRGFKYKVDNTIDESWYSDYCNPTNGKGKNKIGCKYPVYIEFDSSIKNNILFK